VNFFQPSFKLKSKQREGAKVTKRYYLPATPYERLLANDRVTGACKKELRRVFQSLDPVDLLSRIREAQRALRAHEVGAGTGDTASQKADLSRFVANLSTAWRDGEVRPTHRKPCTEPRPWRTRVDPFQEVWPLIEHWLNEQPDATAKGLFQRLLNETTISFAPGQLRTLQRRVREWRTAIARQLVLGTGGEVAEMNVVNILDPLPE
jgi:hypothetical protein